MAFRSIVPATERAGFDVSNGFRLEMDISDTRRRATTACLACKRRKIKCSGRPLPCDPCKADHLECIIDLSLDGRRKFSAKRMQEDLEAHRRVLHQLLNLLFEPGMPKLQEIMPQLQNSNSLAQVAKHIDAVFRPPEHDGRPLIESDKNADVMTRSNGQLSQGCPQTRDIFLTEADECTPHDRNEQLARIITQLQTTVDGQSPIPMQRLAMVNTASEPSSAVSSTPPQQCQSRTASLSLSHEGESLSTLNNPELRSQGSEGETHILTSSAHHHERTLVSPVAISRPDVHFHREHDDSPCNSPLAESNWMMHLQSSLQVVQRFPSLFGVFAERLDDHVSLVIALHGWTEAKRQISLDPQWLAIEACDRIVYSQISPLQRITRIRLLRRIGKYFASPSADPQIMRSIPTFFHPLRCQTGLDPAHVINYIPWPGIRQEMIQNQRRYMTDRFWGLYVRSVHFVWPFDFNKIFETDPLTGMMTMSKEFDSRCFNLDCWTLRKEFLDEFQELRPHARQYEPAPSPTLLVSANRDSEQFQEAARQQRSFHDICKNAQPSVSKGKKSRKETRTNHDIWNSHQASGLTN